MIVNNISDNHITGLKINDNIVSDKNIIGTFVKNSGELNILNFKHMYDNLKGKYLDIKNLGQWYVNDIKTDEDALSSTLSLYDCGQKFDQDYEDSFSFPATMEDWATWIGTKVGVPLKGNFLNSKLLLKERPYLGTNPKYRDAVKKIAKYASGWVQINYDNTYSIKWFDNTIHTIEDWEDFVHGKKTAETNVIVLSTGDTNDNVKWPQKDPQEPHELRIEDEWTNIDRYSINENIYNQVKGFCYTSISKLNIPFGVFIRAGSKIKTKDIELNDIETYISKVTLEWQGGNYVDENAWSTVIVMEELNETSTKLKFANAIPNRLLNVERLADKNKGLIQDLVEENTEYETRITKVEQTSKELSQKISGVYDFVRESSGNNKLIIEQAQAGPLQELHITGSMELSFLNDDLYLSENTSLLDSYLVIADSKNNQKRILLPIEYLYVKDNVSDEFVLERIYNESTKKYESKIKVIRRITLDSSGNKIIASKETIENLGTLEIELFKGTNRIYLESFENMTYSAKYAVINEASEQLEEYALKKELETAIVQTEEKIEESAKLKVDNEIFETYRTQTAKLIEDKVSNSTFQSFRQQTANSFSQTVQKGNLISSINQSEEDVTIEASKINLKSADIIKLLAANTIDMTANEISFASTNFNVDKNGTVNAKNIIATGGTIGGFTITSSKIYGGDSSTGVAAIQLPSADITWVFAAGGSSHSSYKDCPFRVSKAGKLYATDSEIEGKITAKSGELGGWLIGTDSIYNETSNFKVTIANGTNSFKDFITLYDKDKNTYPFYLRADGTLHAEKGDFKGNVTADTITCTNGTFAGWKVSQNGLSGDRLNLNSTNGAIEIYPAGGGILLFNDGVRLAANKGVMIASSSNGNKPAPQNGDLNIIACNSKAVYLSSQSSDNGFELHSVCIDSSGVRIDWNYYTQGSARVMKKNIKLLTTDQESELYRIVSDLKLYSYDYKKQYYNGQKNNYGFLIDEMEGTILEKVLHIQKSKIDKKYKTYNQSDLSRLNFILIKILMKKNAYLQKQINSMEGRVS